MFPGTGIARRLCSGIHGVVCVDLRTPTVIGTQPRTSGVENSR
jgi:hypothetical protein